MKEWAILGCYLGNIPVVSNLSGLWVATIRAVMHQKEAVAQQKAGRIYSCQHHVGVK